MKFSQLRNSRIPRLNSRIPMLNSRIPKQKSRIPKPCIILRIDPMISVLGNSKIPYRDPRVKLGDDRKRDPRVKLGDDTEHARRAFYRDCFASLAMTEF